MGAMPIRKTNVPVRWTLALIALAAGVLAACYVYIGADGSTGGGLLDITQQPRSQTVTAGARATFSVGVAGTGTLTFQWHRNGVDVAGANGVSYTTPPTVLADDGSLFTIQVCNELLCRTSSSALLTVLP